MKTLGIVLKVLAVLALVAGAVYVAVTYGDKIVAWVKKVFRIPEKRGCGCTDCEDCHCDTADCADCECDFYDSCEEGNDEDFE